MLHLKVMSRVTPSYVIKVIINTVVFIYINLHKNLFYQIILYFLLFLADNGN